MRTHGAVVGRRFRSVTKLTTKVRIGRGYLWRSFLTAAAALKTPTRNGYNAQGVNLKFQSRVCSSLSAGLEGFHGVLQLGQHGHLRLDQSVRRAHVVGGLGVGLGLRHQSGVHVEGSNLQPESDMHSR